MDINQIAALAGIVALRACGHPGKSSDAPAPIAGYALAFSAAVTGLAVASQSGNRPDQTDWTGAPTEQIAQALYSIARDGLIPGGIGDPSATAYIFKGKGSAAPTGRPSPRGRLVMARAAGCDVRALAIGKADSLTLDDSGDVDHLELDPDARPGAWGDLRGVVLHVDDLRTGARRSLWIARADLAERKAKAGQKSAWDTDAVGMALTKAVSIAITRGAIPQASLIPAILAASAALGPTPARALTIEAAAAPRQLAEPTPAAPPPADPEPTPEPTGGPSGLTIYTALADVKGWLGAQAPDGEIVERALSKQFALLQIASRTTGETVDRDNLTHDQHRKMVAGALADIQARPQPEAPAEPEQPKPEADGDQISSPWVTPAITWGFVQAEIFDRWEGTEKQSMPDDLGLAIHGAVVEAQRKSAEAGRPLTPEGAMRPAVLARIVELAQAHLRSM
jgi:hypothetical protein